MLSQIVESGNRPFRLHFVRGTGKNIGQIREALCYYGAPNPKDPQAPTDGEKRRKARVEFIHSNQIPLTEFGTRQLLTPFISHILTFNGKKVIY